MLLGVYRYTNTSRRAGRGAGIPATQLSMLLLISAKSTPNQGLQLSQRPWQALRCWVFAGLGCVSPAPCRGQYPELGGSGQSVPSLTPRAPSLVPCSVSPPPPAPPALLSPPGPPPSLLCQHGASHCAETPLEKPAGLLLAQRRQSWGAEGGPHPTPQHKTGVLGRDPQPHPGCTLGAWAGCGDAPSLLIWGWDGREARGC